MKTKWWIIIFAAASALCVVASILLTRGLAPDGTRAGVFFDGELLREIDLSESGEPYSLLFESELGQNTVTVENGRIYISSADCHDQYCVRHAPLPSSSSPIVCLPHRLVIRMMNAEDSGYDAITGTAVSE